MRAVPNVVRLTHVATKGLVAGLGFCMMKFTYFVCVHVNYV